MVSGCGVTANILVLGTSDSGFESLHPDKKKEIKDFVYFLFCVIINTHAVLV